MNAENLVILLAVAGSAGYLLRRAVNKLEGKAQSKMPGDKSGFSRAEESCSRGGCGCSGSGRK
jgi:hypothetical protein